MNEEIMNEVVDLDKVEPLVESEVVETPEAIVEEKLTGKSAADAAFDKLMAEPDKQDKTDEKTTKAEEVKTDQVTEPVKGLDPTGRGPNSWNASEREEFKKCTPLAQQAILRRENEHQRLMAETTDVRKFASEFVTVINPYEAYLNSIGVPALAAVKDLMNTAYAIKTGDAQTKARMFAQMITHNNIDVSLVDQYLSNQPPPVDPQTASLQRELNEIKQWRDQQVQSTQHQSDQNINQTIESFASDPANEFFSDVIGDMQVLLNAGRANDLKSAYDMACRMNPDVSSVIQSRSVALATPQVAHTTQTPVTTQQKLNAAGSVKGAPATTKPAQPKPKLTGREAAMAAWEKTSNK